MQIAIKKLLLPGEEMSRLKTEDEMLNSAHMRIRHGDRIYCTELSKMGL